MRFYITTPIFYVNAQPHLGHAYTAIVTDTAGRFQKLLGKDVRFQTGTDEHGDKIAQAAADAGETPKSYADRISGLFRDAWPPLDVRPDNFIRTTDAAHVRTVQNLLQQVYDRGDIYFAEYSGLYCKGCERFLTEKEVVDGLCPDHRTAPQPVSEQNYFFRMSRYRDWLVEHITAHPEFITPERYRNEVLSFLKEPLEDLCISRPTSRLTWGIPLPFDDKFVTYVWFDALINYITGLGYPDGADFAAYWPAAEHVIAKDILKPHAIYWPTMLKAMGIAPYRRLHVHGYWNVNDTKMSKSLGNVVRPGELVERYGSDAVRYFLLREMSFGVDSSFSEEALLGRQNADLANDLGNLFSRSLAMVKKFVGGRVPAPAGEEEIDRELRAATEAMLGEYRARMEEFAFNRALMAVWEVIGRANRYIVANEPWVLAKDPAKRPRLDTMLFYLLESLRLIALTVTPVMPAAAARMHAALGIGAAPDFTAAGRWGLLNPGTALAVDSPPLFPRIDREAAAAPATAAPAPAAEADNLIAFDQFQQLDLRVAEIVAAEKVKKSDRLLKLTVRAPEERTIVSGIAEHFPPEELVGRKVVIVANLKPAKLMGIASQGMVLAAKDGGQLVLVTVGADIAAGSRVS
ncbi:MAG: methionine--tRNA ligase [Thermodesulfobacteriota bacterium]